MKPGCADAFGLPATISRQVMGMVLTLVGSYRALIDPRPDLARPARRSRLSYVW